MHKLWTMIEGSIRIVRYFRNTAKNWRALRNVIVSLMLTQSTFFHAEFPTHLLERQPFWFYSNRWFDRCWLNIIHISIFWKRIKYNLAKIDIVELCIVDYQLVLFSVIIIRCVFLAIWLMKKHTFELVFIQREKYLFWV